MSAFHSRDPDVHLYSQEPSSNPLIQPNAKLTFLSVVEIALIPLYLSIGPSLEVRSGDGAATEWFSEALIPINSSNTINGDSQGGHQQPWWTTLRGQSDRGILLKVEHTTKEDAQRLCATEVLLYAATETHKPALPTPPTSSSPGPGDEGYSQTLNSPIPILKLYALPLSSDILERAQLFDGLISPAPNENSHAYFLPNNPAEKDAKAKRRKISSLFDDATRQRRKLKGKGGENVAHTMANIDRPASQHGNPRPSRNMEEIQAQSLDQNDVQRPGISRSSSLTSFQAVANSRPVSRSSLPGTKRSSLHRVESAYSTCEGSVASDIDNVATEQNKAALSRIILTGMRLHGLQQKKKLNKDIPKHGPPRRFPTLGATAVDEDGEDDYKLVYHQTLKAATFAFRNNICIEVIDQEAMRGVVDRLLDMFCTDPTSPYNDPIFGLSDLRYESTNPFDLPSSSSQAINDPGWSTPATKKRKLGIFGGVGFG